jgi:hypothetical protein
MFLVDQNGNPCIYTSPKAQARLERERRDHRLMVRAGIAVVVFTLCCCVAAAIKAASESANASPSEYGPAVHVVRALGADLRPPDECFIREVVWTFACGMTTVVLTLSVLTAVPVSKPAEVADVWLDQR